MKNLNGRTSGTLTLVKFGLLIGMLSLFSVIGYSAEIHFYVSPDGNDSNAGSISKPFKTVMRARDAVRSVKWRQNKYNSLVKSGKVSPVGDITVWLRGGRYYLGQPIEFDENDSGNFGYHITYKNYPGEIPVIVGGQPVTGWQKFSGHIYRAYVPYLKDDFLNSFQLLENGVPGTIARTPNEGWLRLENPDFQSFGYKKSDFNPSSWDTGQLQINLIEVGTYFSAYLPVDHIDTTACRIVLQYLPKYTNWMTGKAYLIQNALALLDSPGEFYADAASGYVYYWPRSENINTANIETGILGTVMHFNSYTSRYPVHHIVIEGVSFEGSNFAEFYKFGWNEEGDNGHIVDPAKEFDETDRYNSVHSEHWAQICLENADQITIKDCRLFYAGMNGIAVIGGSTNHTITGCEIAGSGSSGVYIKGDMASYLEKDAVGILDINRGHTLHNNYIHHVGRLLISGNGVSLTNTSGNMVSNNLITDIPRNGICVNSQWNIPLKFNTLKNNTIIKNEIARYCVRCWDEGAFYIGATAENTWFDNNRITDGWSFFNATWPQPEDRPDDVCSIDFDYVPKETHNTYIRNNLCYGQSAGLNEMDGMKNGETFVENNWFESPGHPGKYLANIAGKEGKPGYVQWSDAVEIDTNKKPFDISKVTSDIGLTAEYRYSYPKEVVHPLSLPVKCGFEGTLSPLFMFGYSDGPLYEFFTSSPVYEGSKSLLIDKDVEVVRYHHGAPLSRKLSIWMYDHPEKTGARCKMTIGSQSITEGGQLPSVTIQTSAGIGVDSSIPGKYVIIKKGKYFSTGIARSTGWHNFELNVNSESGTTISIDSKVVGSVTGVTSFTIADIGDADFGSDSKGICFDSLIIQ